MKYQIRILVSILSIKIFGNVEKSICLLYTSSKDDIVRIVTTGYGRAYINSGDDSITEITCHAKGAHYLNPNVRTVIDVYKRQDLCRRNS